MHCDRITRITLSAGGSFGIADTSATPYLRMAMNVGAGDLVAEHANVQVMLGWRVGHARDPKMT
jgi:hypothetical protein